MNGGRAGRGAGSGVGLLVSVLLLVAMLFAGCAASPPLPAEPVGRGDTAGVQRQLRAFIENELSAHDVAGLSIALVDDQRIVWAEGFGWADVAARQPALPTTLYRVGSISKLFTDTAAMQLVAQRRLDLDAPIEQVLPWFRIGTAWPGSGPITLRHLMSHHAGLPRDTAAGMWLASAPAPGHDFRAMLRGLADEQTDAPPGRAFGYSNIGIDLVGAMLEARAGLPFESYLQSAVLDPIGMQGARFGAAPPEVPAMARGHFAGQPRAEPALRDVPAGGLSASVVDLARFLMLQFAAGRGADGAPVLPASQQAAMLERQFASAALDADFSVGLGWMLTTFGTDTVRGGGPVAHHAGATLYFRSQMMMLPAHRLGVVVAANDGAAGARVNRIAQRALALLLEAKSGIRQPVARPGFEPVAQPWSADDRRQLRERCAGDYVTLAGPVSLRAEGEGLSAELDGRTVEVQEGREGRFGLRYRMWGLLPVALGPLSAMGFECGRIEGRQVLTAVLDGERMLVGERIAAGTLTEAQAAAWVGRYRPQIGADEIATLAADGDVRIRWADRRLWVEYRLHEAFGGTRVRALLVPMGEDALRVVGPLADSGPVARLIASEPALRRFRFSGWTFERVAD